MNNIGIILVLIGGVVLTVGDVFMKKWVGTDNYLFYVFGMLIYLVGLNFLAQSFKYKNIAVASVILVLFNVITLALFSWLYFKETLTTTQIIGIVLGLTSVVVLESA